MNKRYQEILRILIQNDAPTRDNMNPLNDSGLTPFLAYINHFSSQYDTVKARMMVLMNEEAVKHKTNYGKYSVDLKKLFTAQPQQ